jgi:ribonuclease HII
MLPPIRTVVRRDGGLYALERALRRRGFELVAGADEAGRGACAGPLVVAAAILPATKRGEVPGLADSKLLTPLARDRVYDEVGARALAYSVVVIPAAEVDLRGLHVCNLAGMRRALAALTPSPDYVLTDGFGVDGLGVPGLGVWKGDRVAACVAAASVVAKVTRDRIMVRLDEEYPGYGFAEHKGYVTEAHSTALHHHGPCTQHRYSYANVAATGQNVASSDVAGLQDAVVGSARSRRRSTVSGAAVASPGGSADVRRHSAGTVLTGQEQLGRAVASANGREGGTG